MGEVTQQVSNRRRRGRDFVLEGVPMFDSPDLSSDSSDDVSVHCGSPYVAPCANAVACRCPLQPMAGHAAVHATLDAPYGEVAWQRTLPQWGWCGERQEQQQPLFRLEHQLCFQRDCTSAGHWGGRQVSHCYRSPGKFREPLRLCPDGAEDFELYDGRQLAGDADHIKCATEDAQRRLFATASVLHSCPSTPQVSVVHDEHGVSRCSPLSMLRQCDPENTDACVRNTANYYGFGCSDDGTCEEAHLMTGRGSGVTCGAQITQTDSLCATKGANLVWSGGGYGTMEVIKADISGVSGNSGCPPRNDKDVCGSAAGCGERNNGGTASSAHTSMNTSSMGGWTSASTATTPQRKIQATGGSGRACLFGSDYDLTTTGAQRGDCYLTSPPLFNGKRPPPRASLHMNSCSKSYDGGTTVVVPWLFTEVGHVERCDGATRGRPSSREYCCMECYLMESGTGTEPKLAKICPPILSIEADGRGVFDISSASRATQRGSP